MEWNGVECWILLSLIWHSLFSNGQYLIEECILSGESEKTSKAHNKEIILTILWHEIFSTYHYDKSFAYKFN